MNTCQSPDSIVGHVHERMQEHVQAVLGPQTLFLGDCPPTGKQGAADSGPPDSPGTWTGRSAGSCVAGPEVSQSALSKWKIGGGVKTDLGVSGEVIECRLLSWLSAP